MMDRMRNKTAGAVAAALIAALGVGGIAAAQNQASSPPAKAATQASPKADDHADGETNDDGPGATDTPDAHERGEKADANEKGEKADGPEKGEKADRADTPEPGDTPDAPAASATR